MLDSIFKSYGIYDYDGGNEIILKDVTLSKTLSNNLMKDDFFERVDFNIATGNLDFFYNYDDEDDYDSEIYKFMLTCEPKDC